MPDDKALRIQVGDNLAGKYRIDKILGQGGMGMVVKALHLDLEEPRAIKFMLPSALSDAEFVERFFREARATGRLKSQHVVKVYDFGRLPDGAPYLVMEHLDGTDLKTVLNQRKILPLDEAVRYILQACEAVGEAHAAGIIHRDLKPANMFMTAGVGGAPCVKVLDFGIAKVTSPLGEGAAPDMTNTAAILGSPQFMSPEQMRSARAADARSDIWSLGVILYRMVTGVLPFPGQSIPDMFAMVLGSDRPHEPSFHNPLLPSAFEAILMRCLAKDPAYRWQSVPELAAALQPFATAGVRAPAPSAPALPPALTVPGASSVQMLPTAWNPSVKSAPFTQPPALALAAGDPSASHTGSSWAKTSRLSARSSPRGMIIAGFALGVLVLVPVAWLIVRPSTTVEQPSLATTDPSQSPSLAGQPLPTASSPENAPTAAVLSTSAAPAATALATSTAVPASPVAGGSTPRPSNQPPASAPKSIMSPPAGSLAAPPPAKAPDPTAAPRPKPIDNGFGPGRQ